MWSCGTQAWVCNVVPIYVQAKMMAISAGAFVFVCLYCTPMDVIPYLCEYLFA